MGEVAIVNTGPRRTIRSVLLNFGPQHPAAHGILKIGLALSGEVITRADLQFGLLHRGSEKLCEARTYNQAIPYLDRMDYVANLIQEHAIVSSIESLVAERRLAPCFADLRVLFDELSRVLNHLLTMSAICLDMGAMGPIFWAFEERELIMEVFERVSGARMHTALYRPFSVSASQLTQAMLQDLLLLIQRGARVICGAFLGLLSNRSFRSRCVGIGSFTPAKLSTYGIHGILARASGIAVDARLGLRAPMYASYASLSVRTFLGRNGDCYDRFVVRARELLESYRIVAQLVSRLTTCPISQQLPRAKFVSMEAVIEHFCMLGGASSVQRGLGLSCVEGPKGFVSVLVASSGSVSPTRVHVRSPVAHNLHLLSSATNGYTFADFVATFCSMDVVLGEIDR